MAESVIPTDNNWSCLELNLIDNCWVSFLRCVGDDIFYVGQINFTIKITMAQDPTKAPEPPGTLNVSKHANIISRVVQVTSAVVCVTDCVVRFVYAH